MKLLTPVVGASLFSVTAVLTVFMGGLALGSLVGGRYLERVRSPLRLYGVLEILVGVYALAAPFIIRGVNPLFKLLYQGHDPALANLNWLRVLLCAIVLLVPTTLMGATLPVLVRYAVALRRKPGGTIASLYGINAAGAVVGALAAGFALIPALGLSRTTFLAAIVNFAVGITAILIARRWQPESPATAGPGTMASEADRAESSRLRTVQLVWICIALSGVAAMIYQVVWTRVLTLFIGTSVYAFSLIVGAFVAGLAIGSLAINRVLDSRRDLLIGLAAVEAGIAASAIAVSSLLGRLPVFVAQMMTESNRTFGSLHVMEFALVFSLVLVPTVLMGVSFPLAATACSRIAVRVGRAVGDVYAANTLGAIIGSFAAGFLLIPTLGTQRSIYVAVTLNAAAAVIVFLIANFSSLPKRALYAAAGCAVLALGCARMPHWNAALLSAGPFLYANQYRQAAAEKGISLEQAMTEGRDLLFFEEGLHAAVSVNRTLEGDLLLGVNGKTDGTARADAPTQLMLGHLPLLIQPEAQDVLIIGLGTGTTLGAVERHPVRAIDVVEIEPAVVHASALFNPFTGSPLKDPRARLVTGDGRNYMALTNRRFDVVISEPSNPWVAGMANLFTRESFEAARAHLRPGGVMCQWVHAYSMSPANFKTIVATFTDVFPNATLWEAELGNDYLLLGSVGPLKVDPAALRAALGRPELKSDLARIDASNLASFLGKLLLDGQALRDFARGAPLHTDDNARLEYSAPRALLGSRSSALIEEIYAGRVRPAARFAALGWSSPPRALADILEADFAAQSEIVAGYLSFASFDVKAAVEHLDRALSLRPDSYQAAYFLAKLYHQFGDQSRAKSADQARQAYQKSVAVIDDAVRRNPSVLRDHFLMSAEYAEANLALGMLFMDAAQLDSASAAVYRSLVSDVRYPEAYNDLGVIFERHGQLDSAQALYQRAVEAHPKYIAARINLGNISLRRNNYDEAMQRYREVLSLRPDYAPAYYNLGVAHFAQRQWREAESDWARALELKPDFEQARTSLVVVRDSLAKAVR